MQIDAGWEGRLDRIASWARACEQSGIFGGFWLAETDTDPLLASQLALSNTEALTVGTNIAVAFARSPFQLAQTAYNLNGLFRGRFRLGLGTQVKAHIERRFSSAWPESPARAMEEYLELLRHLFACFNTEEKPEFVGEHYRCTLSSPVFSPDPHDFGGPPLGLAAVGPGMVKVAGRSADMLMLHPFTHHRYLQRVTQPALAQALPRRAPELPKLELIGSAFVVATDSPQAKSSWSEVTRRVAFYASTPNYARVLEELGYPDLPAQLSQLARQGAWAELARALPRAVLAECVVSGPRCDLPALLKQRYSEQYHRVIVDPRQLLPLEGQPN